MTPRNRSLFLDRGHVVVPLEIAVQLRCYPSDAHPRSAAPAAQMNPFTHPRSGGGNRSGHLVPVESRGARARLPTYFECRGSIPRGDAD